MNKEEKFIYDIDNIKKDFEIESMKLSLDDIDMLKKYNNNEITANDMIDSVVNFYKIKN